MQSDSDLLDEFISACKVHYGQRVVIDLSRLKPSGRWVATVHPPRGFWTGSAPEVFIVSREAIDNIIKGRFR